MILASRSPQRKEILERLGVEFEVIPSDLDESTIIESDPIERAKKLAEAKAADVAAKHPGRWTIGVDTLVVSADGELLEKPVDADDARRMLKLHSGRTSMVHSALCLMRCHGERRRTMTLVDNRSVPPFVSAPPSANGATEGRQDDNLPARPEIYSDLSTAHVTFNSLDDETIEWWIASNLWQDRSGAFQIDGVGERLVASLDGEFETVVGFPVRLFQDMIKTL